MRNKRLTGIAISLAIAVMTGLAIAQLTEPAPSPAPLFPQGALVYAESRDLKQLLDWWADSETKSRWEETSNYTAFQNSRLYQRLDERLSEFGKGQFAFTLENLREITGTRSAIALYDIGELKAVAVTRVGFTEAAASELWASRIHLKQRKSGNQNYYVEPKEGKLAFAFAKPYLVVASEEALLLDVLKAMKDPQPSGRLVQSEKWQQLAARQPATNGIITLYLDQENLTSNNYFESYWLPQNFEELKPIQAAWINVEVQDGAIVEHRYFVQDAPAQTLADAADYLKPFESVHRESLVLTAGPSSHAAADRICRLFNRLPEGEPAAGAPPVYSAAAERVSKAEARSSYLEKIDEPILTPAADKLLHLDQNEKIAGLLEAAAPAAEIRFAYPLWDDRALFVQFPESIALQLGRFDALNQQQLLDVLLEYFRTLHSTQDQGARWIDRGNGEYALDALLPVFVKFKNPWVAISTRNQEFQQLVQALPATPTAPAASYAEFEMDKARWKYSRLMKRLDAGAYSGDSPLFFSDNLDGLIQTSEPVKRTSILRNSGEEIIRYELR